MKNNMVFSPIGDCALNVSFGNEISPETNGLVVALEKELEKNKSVGIREVVPTFRSLLVYYDPLKISYSEMVLGIQRIVHSMSVDGKSSRRVVHVPVCYGGEFGADMKNVEKYTGLSEENIVRLHTSTNNLIYMLGFLPGFTYLGGMDDRLKTPRLETPRTRIPAGSVGIGGAQTGIYPLDSPGGWQLIGRTPMKPYDPRRKNPIAFQAGDFIRFYSIDKDEYDRILKMVENRTYEPKVEVAR